MTEVGFTKADSKNLPVCDGIMIANFFSESDLFNAAEIRGVKTDSSGRKNYGDSAVGYVQLKREGNICILKSKVCPEHKVRSKQYNVTVTINEEEEKVTSILCHDCPASSGGCKHAVAFLMWIHRRSEEPSPTEVDCYWKKSKLSGVGTNLKYITVEDFGAPRTERLASSPAGSFLESVINNATAKNSSMQLLKYFQQEKSLNDLSIHTLLMNFLRNGGKTCNEFYDFCKNQMISEDCKAACNATTEQSSSKLWHELRYGRITASRIYEAARCKTSAGSLIESLTGGIQVRETKAMTRGKILEKKVLEILEKEIKIKLKSTGLLLSPKYPFLGASPDAICEEFVIEIKCPASAKTIKNYINNGNITNKFKAQIQLQMHIFDKKKEYFV